MQVILAAVAKALAATVAEPVLAAVAKALAAMVARPILAVAAKAPAARVVARVADCWADQAVVAKAHVAMHAAQAAVAKAHVAMHADQAVVAKPLAVAAMLAHLLRCTKPKCVC